MNLSNVVIILDHPDEPRNIGAACRAMANNDIKTLRIVGKKDDYEDAALEHIKVLAIHAGYIFDNVEFFDSIKDATKDCSISAATQYPDTSALPIPPHCTPRCPDNQPPIPTSNGHPPYPNGRHTASP